MARKKQAGILEQSYSRSFQAVTKTQKSSAALRLPVSSPDACCLAFFFSYAS
jgi:hypothetical protein